APFGGVCGRIPSAGEVALVDRPPPYDAASVPAADGRHAAAVPSCDFARGGNFLHRSGTVPASAGDRNHPVGIDEIFVCRDVVVDVLPGTLSTPHCSIVSYPWEQSADAYRS